MSETDKQTNRKTERETRGKTKTEKETEKVKQREIVYYTFIMESGRVPACPYCEGLRKGERYSKGLRLMIIGLLSLWITVT